MIFVTKIARLLVFALLTIEKWTRSSFALLKREVQARVWVLQMKDMQKVFALLKNNCKRWIIESCLYAGVIKIEVDFGTIWFSPICLRKCTRRKQLMHKLFALVWQHVDNSLLADCKFNSGIAYIEQNINMYKICIDMLFSCTARDSLQTDCLWHDSAFLCILTRRFIGIK